MSRDYEARTLEAFYGFLEKGFVYRGLKPSLLGTIALGGGRRQVTYAGHPLYTYAFDSGPAETGYVGATQFGGTWRALSATGRPLG